MYIVHTSDFAHLEIHENYRECYIDMNLLRMVNYSIFPQLIALEYCYFLT